MDIIQKRANGSIRQAISFVGLKKRTRDEFKKDVDINSILKKYIKSGEIDPAIINQGGTFMDVSDIGDFTAVTQRLEAVKAEFMKLKPEVRAKFENDPAKLLSFVKDEKNLDECISLGILPKSLKKPIEEKPKEEKTA